MINLGYTLSVKDADELKKFKESAAYGTYLKAIGASPAFRVIMKEHLDGVDVSEDIKTLKNQGKLPDAVNPKALSDLFKQSLSKLAMCLVADSIILKELETVKIEEVLGELSGESEVNYLLGKADKKYYEQASKLVEQNKLDENSVGYRGLTAYLKHNGKLEASKKVVAPAVEKPRHIPAKKEETPKSLDSDDISL
jgi:hypothetical protein